MAAKPLVVLVVGPPGSGKTWLLRRLAGRQLPTDQRPTVGLDLDAGSTVISAEEVADCPCDELVPPGGLELVFWEIGGREHREAPRGRLADAVLLCYDASDRISLLRAATVLCSCRFDERRLRQPDEGLVRCRPPADRTTPVLLCGTKADSGAAAARPVVPEEVVKFVEAHFLQGAVLTSAASGAGIQELRRYLAAVLLADASLRAAAAVAAEISARDAVAAAVAAAWSLPVRCGDAVLMTSPRGAGRLYEPPRGTGPPRPAASALAVAALPAAPGERLVEVIGSGLSAPRTVARCLQQGLLHRAVHIWIHQPRTGGLLLRKWTRSALKHPGTWGPTCHGEVLSYGTGGDGHAAELSAQAAARLVEEQLGVHASSFGPLEHWFSGTSKDGLCNELVDVYMAALEGSGLPVLRLLEDEEVDWVYFAQAFGKEVEELGQICHLEVDYRTSMFRRLRRLAVREDVLYVFGEVAVRADPCLAGA